MQYIICTLNTDKAEPVSIKNIKCGECNLGISAIEVNVEQLIGALSRSAEKTEGEITFCHLPSTPCSALGGVSSFLCMNQ